VDKPAEEVVAPPVVVPGIHRRLYDWVLSWAESRWGTVALFGLSFAESSFFPVPPDPLLMALGLGKRSRSLYYAFVCSVASVLGGILGYIVGAYLWDAVRDICFTYLFRPDQFESVRVAYDTYNFWVVFTAGFTPIPFKVFTITGGVFGINFAVFVLASAIGRSARFFLVAGLIYRFGAPIRRFIDRYFNLLSILFVVLLVGGALVVRYVL
jgi:membrane protein YqaA with SNARE-associated domain